MCGMFTGIETLRDEGRASKQGPWPQQCRVGRSIDSACARMSSWQAYFLHLLTYVLTTNVGTCILTTTQSLAGSRQTSFHRQTRTSDAAAASTQHSPRLHAAHSPSMKHADSRQQTWPSFFPHHATTSAAPGYYDRQWRHVCSMLPRTTKKNGSERQGRLFCTASPVACLGAGGSAMLPLTARSLSGGDGVAPSQPPAIGCARD